MTTGSVLAQFTITLSQAVSEQVAVEWHTEDGTAQSGVDYAPAKGTVLFAPGETSKMVDILVYGRAVGSEDRSFFVEMLPPVNAILGASIGECIIHVDTTGSTPVTQILVPTGPRGLQGDSAYQSWLDLGNTGTEQDFINSLKPSAAEIAQEVAPLIDLSNSPLTAEGTETLSKPDTMTVKRLARRVAYVGSAKVATAVLAAGDNLISHASLSGDEVDFSSISLHPRILRGTVVISPEWSVEPDNKILIKDAMGGDVLHVCQYDIMSGVAITNAVEPIVHAVVDEALGPVYSSVATVETQAFEVLRRSYADAGYNLVSGSFEAGGTLVDEMDVLLHAASGKAYSGPTGSVDPGTDPSSGGFVDRSIYGVVAEKVKSKLPFSGAAEVTQLFNNSLYLSARQFYGVTGDGSDQTVGLQNAIYAASGGGVLFIDNGVYGISDYLKIPSKTKIVMAPYAIITRLTATRSSTGGPFDAVFINDASGEIGGFSANTDIHIEGGVVDGGAALINNSATLIAFGHCSRVSVTRTTLLNTGGDYHAIEINATKQATIRDCVIDNAGGLNSEAIQIDNSKGDGRFPWFGPYDGAPCTEIHIDNCSITNFGWAVASHAGPAEGGRHSRIKITNCVSSTWRGGIRSFSWTNTKILNCTIAGNLDRGSFGIAGIFLEWVSDSDLSDTVISGCTISGWNNGGADIRIVGSSASSAKLNVVRISNCSCYPATKHSLYIKNAFGVTINGNDFAQPFTAGVPSVEIYDGDKITFTGNRVTGGARFGNSASVGVVSVAATGNHIGGTMELLPTVSFSVVVGNRASLITNTSTAVSNVVASNSV